MGVYSDTKFHFFHGQVWADGGPHGAGAQGDGGPGGDH